MGLPALQSELPTHEEAEQARRDMCRQRLTIAANTATGDLATDIAHALTLCDRSLTPGDWKALDGLSLRLLMRSLGGAS